VLSEAQVQQEIEAVQGQPRDHKDHHHAEQQVQGSIPTPAAAHHEPAACRTAAAGGMCQRHAASRQAAVATDFCPPRPENEATTSAAADLDGEAAGDGEAAAAKVNVLWRRRWQAVIGLLVPEGEGGEFPVDPAARALLKINFRIIFLIYRGNLGKIGCRATWEEKSPHL